MAKDMESLAESRKVRQQVITKFGEVPTSIWTPDYGWGKDTIELDSRKQQAMAKKKHEKMDYGAEVSWDQKKTGASKSELEKVFGMSSQNVRGKQSGLSTFPPDLARKIVMYYSEKDDTVLDPCCVSGDTLISIPEGDVKIKDLVGKNPYVYCYGNGSIRLRKALRVWRTQVNAKVIKITLDDDTHICVTENHEFMLRDGSYIMAKNLKVNESLMPFYRKIHKQSRRYVLRLNNGEFQKRQSIFIMEELLDRKLKTKERLECVHHKDGDRTNDAIDNLSVELFGEHSRNHHIGVVTYTPNKETKKKLSEINTGAGNPFYKKQHSDASKEKIGASSRGRNIGKEHKKSTIQKMKSNRNNKSFTPKILELLKVGKLTHKEIAEVVGVHKNTVGNIHRNRFNYNHKVKLIEPCSKSMDVYNMTVDEFHNYVANGVVIKNCGHNSRMQVTYQLERNYIGYDICHEFMEFNRKVKDTITGKGEQSLMFAPKNSITLREQSSEQMVEENEIIDMIYTSPPYYTVEYYDEHPEQLAFGKTYEQFLNGITRVMSESYRVLKKDKYCIFNINDFRMNGDYYMYHSDIARIMQKVGFKLWDIIIVPWASCIGACFASQIWDRKITGKKHEYLVIGKKTNIGGVVY